MISKAASRLGTRAARKIGLISHIVEARGTRGAVLDIKLHHFNATELAVLRE